MLSVIDRDFHARLPAVPPSPVVVSVPHAGVATRGFEARCRPIWTCAATRTCSSIGCTALGAGGGPPAYVAARLSRFVCDLNRDPDDVSAGAVPEHPAPPTPTGAGSSGR